MINLMAPKTVDGAIAGLLKAQSNLETVAANRTASANDARDAARSLLEAARVDDDEAIRANAVLGKLKAITGDNTAQE